MMKLSQLPRLRRWFDKGSTAALRVDVGAKSGEQSFDVWYRVSDGFALAAPPKPRLVLVHGYPTSSADFHRVMPALEAHFCVLSWDMVGYGFSVKKYLNVMKQVTVFEALLAHLLADGAATATAGPAFKFHVLSHDLGDTIMQEMLGRVLDGDEAPFQVSSVVALNGGMLPGMHRPTVVQRALLNPCLGPIVKLFMNKHAFQRAISKVFGPKSKPSALDIEEFYHCIHVNGGAALLTQNIKYMDDRVQNKERYVGSLRHWSETHPVLVLIGPADPVSGRHLGLAMRDQVEHARVVFLDKDTGHWPQLEEPNGLLREFFNFHSSQDVRTFSVPPAYPEA